jgi:hypothetical protein
MRFVLTVVGAECGNVMLIEPPTAAAAAAGRQTNAGEAASGVEEFAP